MAIRYLSIPTDRHVQLEQYELINSPSKTGLPSSTVLSKTVTRVACESGQHVKLNGSNTHLPTASQLRSVSTGEVLTRSWHDNYNRVQVTDSGLPTQGGKLKKYSQLDLLHLSKAIELS